MVTSPSPPSKVELAEKIAARNTEGAKLLASRMPPEDVGDVLARTAANGKSSVRLLVLEIAAGVPSTGASRAILGRLTDGDLTVRSVAGSLIGNCTQKSLVPEMLNTMKEDLPASVKGALARQVGAIGDPTDIAPLHQLYAETRDPELRQDMAAALAKLGDQRPRNELIQRLTNMDAGVRVRALRDTEYVGDPTLVRYFGEALRDRRDALDISPPHETPVVWARVCDVAIQSMAILGVRFSFGGLQLQRWGDAELAEARHVCETSQLP